MTTLPLSRPLDGLRSADEGSFGGKSAHLGELLQAGIPVPPGFALSAAAFAELMREQGLKETVDTALAGTKSADVASLSREARAIADAIRAVPVPEAVRAEIELRYSELAARTGLVDPPTAVRSSAIGEDGAEATFAGQQETYLWVTGIEAICLAVRDCWASLFSAEAISYRARLGSAAAEPAVTVQLMVDAAVAGVLFTCSPVSGDPSMVAVNASWGLGVAVVGGEVTPDDYLISKVTREVVRTRIGSKEVQYLAAPGGGMLRETVPPDRQAVPCLDEHGLAALVEVARRVERHFGSHQDVEWAIARGTALPDALFVLQSRPVTALPEPPRSREPLSAMALLMGTFGAGAAPGQTG